MALKSETKNFLTKLKTDLQKHLEKRLFKGDTWYLIHNGWMKLYKKYVGFEGTMYDSGSLEAGDQALNPGPIDNKALFRDDNSGEIRDHLIDELDYVLVPEEGWIMLVEHFKLETGQEPIARKVVEHGMFVKHIEKVMRTEFNINEGVETRLWNKYTSNTYEQLVRLDNTVQDAGLFSGQLIIIEQKNEDGTWPRQSRRSREEIIEDREGSVAKQVKTGLKIRKELHKFKYETAESENQFVKNMKTIYNLDSFSDLVIFCGDQKFLVHKNILASRSDVFREMLENEDGKIEGDLEIVDASPVTFKMAIDHMYTGKIPNNIDNKAEELLRLATKYNLEFLAKACELSLLEQLTDKNALETLETLDKHKSTTGAKNDVIKYITLNAIHIIDTEEFQAFAEKQPKLMIDIFRRFAFNQNSETVADTTQKAEGTV